MSDLESIIKSSIADLPGRGDDGADGGDAGDDDGGVDNSQEAEVHDGGDDGDDDAAAAAADDGDDTGGAADEDAEAAARAAAEATADPLEDPFAKEFGLTEPKPGQRENRVPYTRVKAIATNAQKKTFKALTGEDVQPNETIEQATARVSGEFKTIREEHTTQRQRIQEMDVLDRLAEEQPAQFVSLMLQANPQFADHFRAALGVAADAAATNGPLGPKPEPDIQLANGAKTYSVDQLEKLQEWQYQRALIEARKENDKRFEPFEKERKSKEFTDKQLNNIRANLQIAMTWEGFEANQAEILAAVRADKTSPNAMMSLVNSYLKVVLPKYKADREAMRKELIAELKKAPAATSIKGSKVANKNVAPKNEVEAAEKAGDLEGVIRASIKNLPGR